MVDGHFDPLAYFGGFKILNFNIFGGFWKSDYFVGFEIYWIVLFIFIFSLFLEVRGVRGGDLGAY